MDEHPLNAAAERHWKEQRQAAFQAAISGTHRFVWVDMNAPMGTNEPMMDGSGRVRLSPDVWRAFMPEETPAWMLPHKNALALLDAAEPV